MCNNMAADMLREIAPKVLAISSSPIAPHRRSDLVSRVGRKAAGLAVLPNQWTPPFIVIEAAAFQLWRDGGHAGASVIAEVAQVAAREARKWPASWDRGVAVRSSATEETLSERGSNDSVELAADYDAAMIGRAITHVFQRFVDGGGAGQMAIIVQARVAHLALGHMSNEQRVSKTVNQWMWEYEPADKVGGRFNSQRDSAPDPDLRLQPSGHRSTDFTRLFRKIGRWCTRLGQGRTHLEWGASANDLWIFQLDFEDDQPEAGVDPTDFLREGDFRPPGTLPSASPFRFASLSGSTGWRKIDKVADFVRDSTVGYPSLIYIRGDAFLEARELEHDLAGDLEGFAHGRIVCRTDCIAPEISGLNLPRTDTVTSSEAVAFIGKTIENFCSQGVKAAELCFILHKFIPAVTAAWAVARKDSQMVRVDSLWGLPDGLQFLPHDSFEYDVKRKKQSSERTRYKHGFLQETSDGQWAVVRVARKATRWRSLPNPDLAEVATRTHEIAQRTGRDIQIMWFCQVPSETGLLRNIPWFSMSPASHSQSERPVSPTKRRFIVRSMQDLERASELSKGEFLLLLDPDEPDLFRSPAFLDRVIEVARHQDFPVGLTGSILSHAFYVIEKADVPVVALNEPTRSRTRQRRVFRKLVRDEIPDRITEGGETVTLAEIAKEEARAALVSKLLEESYELLAADTPQDVTAELADVLEVVRSLAAATGVDWEQVLAAADQKRLSRGGFERSVVLLETSWPGWLTENRQSAPFTIPLRHLGQVSGQDGTYSISFPALLASGQRPIIRLEDGTKLEVSMGGSGIRISEVTEERDGEQQPSFDF